MFSAPREPPRKPTGFQSWGDRDETTEHFFPQEKSGGVLGFSHKVYKDSKFSVWNDSGD